MLYKQLISIQREIFAQTIYNVKHQHKILKTFHLQGKHYFVTKHYFVSLKKVLGPSIAIHCPFFCPSKENHILEDVNKCVIALQEGDVDTLDRTAGAIRGRAARVVHIINAEMENYEPGVYTERVLESIKLLSETG